MKIIIAPDSFKGSLSALEVAKSLEKGIKKAIPNSEIFLIPLADGGEGTVETILSSLGGVKIFTKVQDPLMRKIEAYYGITHQGKTAVIEMASASGLTLLKPEERNPILTSTYGTGELIKDALDKNCKEIILCIGGSATNDAGAGMLQALGASLKDKKGMEIGQGGGELGNLETIDLTNLDKRLEKVNFMLASDVDNPLYGEQGASFVFGGQKGATLETIKILDKNLEHFARISEKLFPQIRKQKFAEKTGAGAAGGLGFALMAFLKPQTKSGIELVMEITQFEKHLQNLAQSPHSLVITGEGRIDYQTQYGKVPFGVAQAAKKYGLPVIAICGSICEGAEILYKKGIDAIFSIINQPMSLEDAFRQTDKLLEETAENVMKMWNVYYTNEKTLYS